MNTVTIPKKIAGGKDDLIVISRKEYDSLRARVVPEVVMTPPAKRALKQMHKSQKEGKLLSYDEFAQRVDSIR